MTRISERIMLAPLFIAFCHIGCQESSTFEFPKENQNNIRVIENFADTLLCQCKTEKYYDDTVTYIPSDNVIITLIENVSDSTQISMLDVRNHKPENSVIPTCEVPKGLISLCILRYIISTKDPRQVSKNKLCNICRLRTQSDDEFWSIDSRELAKQKARLKDWYSKYKAAPWEIRRSKWESNNLK